MNQEQVPQFCFSSLCTHFPSLEFPHPLRSFRTLPFPEASTAARKRPRSHADFPTCPRKRTGSVLFCSVLLCLAAATKNEFKNRIFSKEKLRLAWGVGVVEGRVKGNSDPLVWVISLPTSSKETLGVAPKIAPLLPRFRTQLY